MSHYYPTRSRSVYKPGFRGGRGMGFRGRGAPSGRGTERFVPRLSAGFRGRAGKQTYPTRNEINSVNPEENQNGYQNQNQNKPVRGGFKVFGRYRSKFDPVNHDYDKN